VTLERLIALAEAAAEKGPEHLERWLASRSKDEQACLWEIRSGLERIAKERTGSLADTDMREGG
jgi:hypothetical protein